MSAIKELIAECYYGQQVKGKTYLSRVVTGLPQEMSFELNPKQLGNITENLREENLGKSKQQGQRFQGRNESDL